MESEATPFLDELRRQIVAAAREGRDRQARTPRAWMNRHALVLAIVAALVLALGAGGALLSRTLGASGHGSSSTIGAAAPNSQVLGPAHSAGAFDAAPPTVGDQFSSIAAAGPSDVWAVGERDYVTNGVPSGASLIEHWDGHLWTVVSCPNIGELVSVTAIGPNDVWAIAQGTGLGRQTLHWDGSTWQVVTGASLLRSHGSGRVTLIAGGLSDAWAIGWGRAAEGAKWGPLAVRWDGVSWKGVPSPGVLAKQHHSTPVSLALLAPDDVWAVGSRNIVLRSSHHKARRPFVEHWNGKVWSVVAAPSVLAGGTELGQIAATPQGDLWAVGSAYTRSPGAAYSERQPVVMRWSGTAWKIMRLPGRLAGGYIGFSSLVVRGRGDVWVGGNEVTPKNGEVPFVAHWDGVAWRLFHLAELGLAGVRVETDLESITAAGADDVWTAAYNGDYTQSSDGSVAQANPVILHWDGTRWSRSAAASYQQP
jgi:hypothetical protein